MRVNNPIARTWFAKHTGDQLTGEYARTEQRTDKNGREHDAAILRSPGGDEAAAWLFDPGALLWAWQKADPQLGDRVRITRVEDRVYKDKQYPDYSVEILTPAKPVERFRGADLDESPF